MDRRARGLHRKDYCGELEFPEVVDPTDQAGETGEFWNIPAVLIDTGIVAQLNYPLAVFKANVLQEEPPEGLIQEFAEDLRIGAMTFNYDGSKSECIRPDPYILYDCADGENRDGAQVISYIDQGSAHTDQLVSAINDIKATTWTPLSEGMYNAIGYYGQNSWLRLNSADFEIKEANDPIEAWCQFNNILLITDGASTADLNADVVNFANTAGHNDDDQADGVDCGTLHGSTLLDDLTHYAKQGTGIFSSEPWENGDKQNITTHVVVAGKLRSTGSGNECSPEILLENAAQEGGTTLYYSEDPSGLESDLRSVFTEIRGGASSASAATVISSSRWGEGAIYQAIFWPSESLPGEEPIRWIGDLHALLVDAEGKMYEDSNGSMALEDSDQRIFLYFDEGSGITKACYDELDENLACTGTSKSLKEVRYLWSATEWLGSISDANITINRSAADYISDVRKRHIFTWNDLDNDGIVAATEILDFESRADWTAAPLTVSGGRGPVPLDFGVQTSAEVNGVVDWVRGLDQAGMRSRQFARDFNQDGNMTAFTWRLGDIVNSTPMAVTVPAEAYHLIYRDYSYSKLVAKYQKRRHVIYFGGNDGMLHAVNGGFYDTDQKGFCRTADCSGAAGAPALGAELWAYVPYNLLPHLQCLTDPAYEHRYFVDLRPRMFDVRIFPDDDDHPDGWGTILVGGMRFGGGKVQAGTLDLDGDSTPDYPGDTREFTSAYFILDITNPEKPPVLLGEFTRTTTGGEVDLGYTTIICTVVPMKEGDVTKWYLMLGTGPTEIDGTTAVGDMAKLAVLPLGRFTESVPKAFRIPDAAPASPDECGVFDVGSNASVSDLITVDYDLESNYKADVVYFGTIEGTWNAWGGKLYRLVTMKRDADGVQERTAPSEWGSLITSKPNPLPLMDVGRPVTSAASVGGDGKNFWIYFGTGRFYHPDDKTDAAQQSFYGLKEPRDADGNLTWETVEKTGDHDTTPGSQGLLRVDQILVQDTSTGAEATLSCSDASACLPSLDGDTVDTFDELEEYIAGTDDSTGLDGWYLDFSEARERNLGQATLYGGLLTFPTYQPYSDVCLSEGKAFLYGLYYRTGTAWKEPVFIGFPKEPDGIDASQNVIEKLEIGRGLVTTPSLHVGRTEGGKAFLQTSTGAIVEIPEPNLPIKSVKTGRISWLEIIE
ncbi:MAG: hypothetical protein JRJ60_15760 [Deltaproteobacteria bacterium]|nr:hypothetical protein [Deltaproteobacteria bacterium]